MPNKLSVLFVLLFLFSGKMSALEVPVNITDTTFTVNKHKITINVLARNSPKTMYNYEDFSPAYEGEVIHGLDSIMMLYGKGAKVVKEKSERWDYYTTKKIICRSGIELIFDYGAPNAWYYPEENVICFEYPDGRGINLTTGEDEIDPSYIVYAPARKFRLAVRKLWNPKPAVAWQKYNSKKKEYDTLLDLNELTTYFEYWKYIMEDNTLYFYAYDPYGDKQIELKITVE